MGYTLEQKIYRRDPTNKGCLCSSNVLGVLVQLHLWQGDPKFGRGPGPLIGNLERAIYRANSQSSVVERGVIPPPAHGLMGKMSPS